MGKLSQNDLIIIVVSVVLGIGSSIAFIFMARTVIPPAPAPQVASGAPALPDAAPVMATALPAGSSSAAGGSPFGGPGGPGGPGVGGGKGFGPGFTGMTPGGQRSGAGKAGGDSADR